MAEASLTMLELLEIAIEAQFTHDAAGRIVADNEPDGDPGPRFFLCRSREGNLWRVRHDVPDPIARELDAIAATEPVRDDLQAPPVQLDAILAALRPDGEPELGHSGPSYRFPPEIPALPGATRITRETLSLLHRMVGDLARLDHDFDQVEPWLAVLVDGAAVTTCYSSRLSDRAAGAQLITMEGYRGRGYGPVATAAWARAVRESGRIPLYGTSWDNTASQAVARKLGLVMYGSGLAIA